MKRKKILNKKILFILCLILLILSLIIPHLNLTFGNSFIISTDKANYYTGDTIQISINASRSAEYNAVSLNIQFNNLIYINSSVASGWTPISGPAVSGNNIAFAGALLGSSVNGNKKILTINFKAPNNPGTATVNVSGTIDGTGLGTGSLDISSSRTITILSRPTTTSTPSPTLTPNPIVKLPQKLIIQSSTHPDPNKWYNKNQVELSWETSDDIIEYSYVFSISPEEQPDNIPDTQQKNIIFNNLKEGSFYFIIKAKNSNGWGESSSFKVNIDYTPPNPFTPYISKNQENNKYLIYFYTKDNLSKNINYTVTINDQKFENVDGYLETDISTINKLEIIAKDEAGNTYKYSSYENTSQNTSNISNSNNEIEEKKSQQSNLICEIESSSNINNKINEKNNILLISLVIICAILFIYSIFTTFYIYQNYKKNNKNINN